MPHARPPAPPVLSAEAMRAADAFTIEDFGVPSLVLMESAGRAAADRIAEAFGPLREKTVAIFCGKGNNGGDGLVAARRLLALGANHVRVVTIAREEEMSEDAAHNARLLQRLREEIDADRLSITPFKRLRQLDAHAPADLHVDALLGTGLTSDLREPVAGLVGWLNEQPQPVIALDVPTGLHTDTGAVLGKATEATLTVTMGAYKVGLLLGEAPRHVGRVTVAEIGLPAFALRRPATDGTDGCAFLTTDAAVRAWLPERPHDAYKYSVGMALIVGGAPGMTGAPVMSASAAARAGAGYVTCACPAPAQNTLAAKLTDVTTLALPSSKTGDLDPHAALEALSVRLEKAQALLVGPGLGRAPGTQRFVRLLLEQSDVPTVIDADGLNALAGQDDAWFKEHSEGRWILTPHIGEFKRLAGKEVSLSDRLRTTQEHARRWNSVLVLKGMPSLAAGPGGHAFICGTGNPALATAGTGDVLAGLIAGLLAQGLRPRSERKRAPRSECSWSGSTPGVLRGTAAALHLGGAAADRYAARRAARSMTAPDLLKELPSLLHERLS